MTNFAKSHITHQDLGRKGFGTLPIIKLTLISSAPAQLGHVVVKNDLQAATIPFDGYARPILFSDQLTTSDPPHSGTQLHCFRRIGE
jgi:hypothetical protein